MKWPFGISVLSNAILLLGIVAWALVIPIAVILTCFAVSLVIVEGLATPVLDRSLLEEKVTPEMEAIALVRFGYTVEDLRGQYVERHRMLQRHPRYCRRIVTLSGTQINAKQRRDELEQMMIASYTRLQELRK